jgi:TRAP-type C4-dicarboxylate transport system permease small subunit
MNKDWLKRAARTFVQAFVGMLALLLIPWLTSLMTAAGKADGGLVEIDVGLLGNIFIAACAAGVIALITFIQNFFEQKTGVDVMPK